MGGDPGSACFPAAHTRKSAVFRPRRRDKATAEAGIVKAAVLQPRERRRISLGLVWVYCPQPMTAPVRLERALEGAAQVHRGRKPLAGRPPSCVILCPGDEDLASEVERLTALGLGAPVLVMCSPDDPASGRVALRAGARGLLHAKMRPEQIIHAAATVSKDDEAVLVPKELLGTLVAEDPHVNLRSLRPRQREILALLAEGLSNAQIAKQLFLSESTVKQHLKCAYKVLQVKNRYQAAALFRQEELGR